MKGFTERAKGFENEFKRNQELQFKVTARSNRLFGLWAAGRIGLTSGEPRETYAKSVVAADFEKPGDEDVIAKVRSDLAEKGIAVSDAELTSELDRAAAEARKQLSQG
jgi:hypothetical protein